ncbi:MAG: AraC family transcriptional regulator [Bacteroidota bacterium]
MKIFIYTVAILGMFMTLILFFFFLVTPKGNRHGNRILAALLLVFGFQVFTALALGDYGYEYFISPHLYIYILKLTCFTSGPLIYYYIKAFLDRNKSIKIHPVHFLPFLCSLAFFGYFKYDIALIGSTAVLINSLCLIQNLAYILFSIYYFKKSNVPFKSFFSDFTDLNLMAWTQIVLSGYITVWIVQLNSLSIYVISMQPGWCAYTSSICALMILIFSLLIIFLLLLKPEIYYAVKYKNNNLDELSKSDYLNKLNTYLEQKKPYLDPEISLEKVASDISVSPRLLSQVINELYTKNFKSFLNDLRIQECIRLFSEEPNKEKTIQEVYYSAGFNSRSVFNELFKARTGLTPKEFKERSKNRQN